MAARSIASLTLSFGLVSIPVKLYSATESSAAIRFKLMGAGGARLRQQYVNDEAAPLIEAVSPAPEPAPTQTRLRSVSAQMSPEHDKVAMTAPAPVGAESAVIERSDMVKGFEFEKGKFVLFTDDELKALQESSRQTIDIVAFIPAGAVDPVYYDKAYFLAPDRRGGKPYNLLLKAMRATGRCVLAKWAWRSKEYVVQVRPTDGGLVLQQLLYADEVRSIDDLNIELGEVSEAELGLAKMLIEQTSVDSYDPNQYVDEEKARILAAVERKIEGRAVVAPTEAAHASGQVVDMMEALRASLLPKMSIAELTGTARKPPRRAPATGTVPEAMVAKSRAKRA